MKTIKGIAKVLLAKDKEQVIINFDPRGVFSERPGSVVMNIKVFEKFLNGLNEFAKTDLSL